VFDPLTVVVAVVAFLIGLALGSSAIRRRK
jgi:hypothetical protein